VARSSVDHPAQSRGWPLLTGERGEYVLARERDTQRFLDTMARSGDRSMFSLAGAGVEPPQARERQQVGLHAGENTFSATPLIWTQATSAAWLAPSTPRRPAETPQVVDSHAKRRSAKRISEDGPSSASGLR
jgi:glucoamylase